MGTQVSIILNLDLSLKSRILTLHPRRVAIYLLDSCTEDSIYVHLKELIDGIDVESNFTFVQELATLSIEYGYRNNFRSFLFSNVFQFKYLKADSLEFLSKLIVLRQINLKNEESTASYFFNKLPSHLSSIYRMAYEMFSAKDNPTKLLDIIASYFPNQLYLERSRNVWNKSSQTVAYKTSSIVIFGTIWGKKEIYIDGFSRLGWPSISKSLELFKANCPETVTLHLYTTPDSIDDLLPVLDDIDGSINIILDTTFLSSNNHALLYRGLCWVNTICKAATSSVSLVALCPDAYYGKGLSTLLDKTPLGGIGVAPVIRCSQNGFFSYFYQSLDTEKSYNWSNLDLLKLAFSKNLYHPCQFLMTSNQVPTFTSIYQNGALCELYSWSQCAFAIKPDSKLVELMFDHCHPRYSVNILDNFSQFVDHEGFHILNRLGKVYRASKVSDFIFVEPSSDTGYNPYQEKNVPPLSRRSNIYPAYPYYFH